MPGSLDVPEVVAALQAANGHLRAENSGLKAENAGLRERVARLERLISRNSQNSSMPPSSDDLPGRKPPERKASRDGGRKPGKQPGALGAFLAWREDPDETIAHFPPGSCECGGDLADAADLGVRYSHQVTDLPEARAVTIQHDRHEVACACGRCGHGRCLQSNRQGARAGPSCQRGQRAHPTGAGTAR